MGIQVLSRDEEWPSALSKSDSALLVVDFTAAWCGPCKKIAPVFEELSNLYPEVRFVKVDVDSCPVTASSQGVASTPTFVFYRSRTRVDSVSGGSREALETILKKNVAAGIDSGVKGYSDLGPYVDVTECECLNEADDHPYSHALFQPEGGFLESDTDKQLILRISFSPSVKVHSLKIRAPQDSGPKTIRIFKNHPTTLDFDGACDMNSTQDLTLTPEELEGKPISLRFVKFQRVQNLQLFIEDNQGDNVTTQIDFISVIGTPIETTNMKEFVKVSGKNAPGKLE